MRACDWPTDEGEPCPRPAAWHTDDLGDFHSLCDECSGDALRCNDFFAMAVDQ